MEFLAAGPNTKARTKNQRIFGPQIAPDAGRILPDFSHRQWTISFPQPGPLGDLFPSLPGIVPLGSPFAAQSASELSLTLTYGIRAETSLENTLSLPVESTAVVT